MKDEAMKREIFNIIPEGLNNPAVRFAIEKKEEKKEEMELVEVYTVVKYYTKTLIDCMIKAEDEVDTHLCDIEMMSNDDRNILIAGIFNNVVKRIIMANVTNEEKSEKYIVK
ncbi:MAG: hypothetical protein ACRCZ9_12420 [Fusobacteriaceae bacterium]